MLTKSGGKQDTTPAATPRNVRRGVENNYRARRPVREAYGSAPARASGYTPAPAVAATTYPAVAGAPRRADLLISFELNSDRLTPVGRESARIFAQALLMPELRQKRFVIAGHTDERGGVAINQPLSERRAQRVASFLIGQGVDPSRLQARGLGASDPLPGRSVADPSNRRVEAELIR